MRVQRSKRLHKRSVFRRRARTWSRIREVWVWVGVEGVAGFHRDPDGERLLDGKNHNVVGLAEYSQERSALPPHVVSLRPLCSFAWSPWSSVVSVYPDTKHPEIQFTTGP